MSDSNPSIVEYFAEHEGYKCGYCKSPNTNYSHGMWAHSLTVTDYQDLIDRGWRRSGKYCYKPTMDMTCCPMYTIKCNVQNFRPTKSQKKVLKRMNRFLAYGKTNDKEMQDDSMDKSTEDINCSDYIDAGFLQEISKRVEGKIDVKITANSKTEAANTAVRQTAVPPNEEANKSSEKCSTKTTNLNPVKKMPVKGLGPDPTKPKPRKAKDIRRERRSMKDEDIAPKIATEKSLEDFISCNLVPEPIHKLQVRLLNCNARDFNDSFQEEWETYADYQIKIHKDKPSECDHNSFKNFLIQSPLKVESSNQLPCGYGSFHQQYILDGKIIAVGVIDILPHCVSSVYLFYDPKYSFLSLGTYAALREIAFTRELTKQCPDLSSYYMGFYIHSCPKMKYKAHYYPSFLLCPETYSWHEYEKCQSKLDNAKYCRLTDDPNQSDENGGEIDWNTLWVLNSRRIKSYTVYQQNSQVDDLIEVKQYATLVGKVCYSNMLLYRN